MNKITIIGNLTRDPELRYTQEGIPVCGFTVAVNRRTQKDHPEADFFRVSVWRGLGEACAKYLKKGSKVCVIGPVRVQTYVAQDGTVRAQMEVTADDVEFLIKRTDAEAQAQSAPQGPVDEGSGFEQVAEDDLPF